MNKDLLGFKNSIRVELDKVEFDLLRMSLDNEHDKLFDELVGKAIYYRNLLIRIENKLQK